MNRVALRVLRWLLDQIQSAIQATIGTICFSVFLISLITFAEWPLALLYALLTGLALVCFDQIAEHLIRKLP